MHEYICPVCGIKAALSLDLHNSIVETGRYIFCPNGHPLHNATCKNVPKAPNILEQPPDVDKLTAKKTRSYRDALRKIQSIMPGSLGGLTQAKEIAQNALIDND